VITPENASHSPGHHPVDIRVVEDADEAARVCAELLGRASGHVVLTGGKTPGRAYGLAAGLRPDWSDAEVWWSDERCVPPDDELSNYRMTKRALLDRLETPPRAVHRIRGEEGAERAAAAYDEELRGVTLELVLLGIGPDGHTASLFPHAPTLAERERRAVPAAAALEPFVDRVTMTIPVLESAPLVIFLVAGPDKAEAVARAFGGPPDEATPASLVRSKNGRTAAILDREAAQRLVR
jgi:6-phosphogluconolactonase